MSPWIRLLRPKQWIKNAFVFAPLFFAHDFLNIDDWQLTLRAAFFFLCISCSIYILNDAHDVEEDRQHPTKSKRPLAAGEIPVKNAILLALVLLVPALCIALFLPPACALVALTYIALNLLYTFCLKRAALVDVFFIAFCYVLRVLMGGYAIEVSISSWIILTTFLLALFLGFGKRYHEVGIEAYAESKSNLRQYNRELLDRLVTISGGAALMAYAIYTTEVARQIGQVEIVYTTAFVAFGLFRYLQMIYVYGEGGEPETIIFKDKIQLVNVALWLVVTLWILF